MIELDKYVSKLDIHRMDHQGLFEYLQHVLPDSSINTLNTFNELATNNEIVAASLRCGRPLPYRLVIPFTTQLKKIKTGDPSTIEKIDQFIRHHRQTNYWEKRKVWLILLIALLICAGIFLFTNKPV